MMIIIINISILCNDLCFPSSHCRHMKGDKLVQMLAAVGYHKYEQPPAEAAKQEVL
jgi:hypothetical protein